MIPLFKVYISPNTIEEISKVLSSGYIGQGEKVNQLEDGLQKYLGSKVLTLNSCTSCIDLVCHLIELDNKSSILTSPMSCSASYVGPYHRGSEIIWVDVDPYTGNIDPYDIYNKIKDNTKSILAIDWAGVSCDYDSLRKYNLPIIEDAAHAMGSYYNSYPISKTGGDYVCWSLQAIKHLTAGDGGILKVPQEQYQRAKLLRWYGLDRESKLDFRCSQGIEELGYKYHMNDISATIALENLKDIEKLVLQHKINAKFISENINNTNIIYYPQYAPDSSYWIYTILVKNRSKFIKYMEDKGISVSQVHKRNDEHPCFKKFLPDKPLEGLDFFSTHYISIPCGWWLTSKDLTYIVETINNYKT